MWSDHEGQQSVSDEGFEHSSEDNCLEVEKPVLKFSKGRKRER